MLWRETELEMIRDIKDRADKVSNCATSEGKGQAFKRYVKNMFTQTGKLYSELQKELEEVLMDTLGGLETLQCFLDAIEKLEFSERQPRMLQFLKELEENAVQLDSMNKGAKISSVVGSSVGAVGGVLSIVGLALIPFTAGVSVALAVAGIGMGVTSGVNSIVTTATELGVNRTHQKKAKISKLEHSSVDLAVGVKKLAFKAGGVCKNIDAIVDLASAAKLLKSEELVSSASKAVAQEAGALRSVSRVASDVPDIGQAAVKSSLGMSKSARAGFIAVNALFLGMDLFFICKDSISLAKGSETEVSQFIRARAALHVTIQCARMF
uniref:Si:ch73-233k15.2 n=1 Tax=Oryzias latipes TaxID=8090 RepID=A0A3P9M9S3_ORYLA